jgi:hypothetical protein
MLDGNPHAINLFRQLLEENWDKSNFRCPMHVKDYIVRILVEKLEKPDWEPKKSFAISYLEVKNPAQSLILGNTCFFARAVFPNKGGKKGMGGKYYVELGQGCYSHVLTYSYLPAVETLRDHFEYCAEMTFIALHNQGKFDSIERMLKRLF